LGGKGEWDIFVGVNELAANKKRHSLLKLNLIEKITEHIWINKN